VVIWHAATKSYAWAVVLGSTSWQGPCLKVSSCKVSIVVGTQVFQWYTITVFGHHYHTGSEPFPLNWMPCHVLIQHGCQDTWWACICRYQQCPQSINTMPGKLITNLTLAVAGPGGGDWRWAELQIRYWSGDARMFDWTVDTAPKPCTLTRNASNVHVEQAMHCHPPWQGHGTDHWGQTWYGQISLHADLGMAPDSMLRVSALLGRRSGFGGVSDSGFSSCTVPTY